MIERIILFFLRRFAYVRTLEKEQKQLSDELKIQYGAVKDLTAKHVQSYEDAQHMIKLSKLSAIVDGFIQAPPPARAEYLRLFLGASNPRSEELRMMIRSFGGVYQAFTAALQYRGPLNAYECARLQDPEHPDRPVDNDVLARYLTTLYQMV